MLDNFQIIPVSLSIYVFARDTSIFTPAPATFFPHRYADSRAIKKRYGRGVEWFNVEYRREFDGKTILILRRLSTFKATFNGSQLHQLQPPADAIKRADKFAAANSKGG